MADIHINIDGEIKKQLKIKAAEKGQTITQIILRAIKNFLRKGC